MKLEITNAMDTHAGCSRHHIKIPNERGIILYLGKYWSCQQERCQRQLHVASLRKRGQRLISFASHVTGWKEKESQGFIQEIWSNFADG